jgi:hypothetical protein
MTRGTRNFPEPYRNRSCLMLDIAHELSPIVFSILFESDGVRYYKSNYGYYKCQLKLSCCKSPKDSANSIIMTIKACKPCKSCNSFSNPEPAPSPPSEAIEADGRPPSSY